MKTALIIHGMPDKENYLDPKADSQSNSHWFPWLQQQLNINGIITQTPEMPEPYNPDYEKWREVIEQFTINENTTLIGHSCGAGFIVKYLSENNIKVGRVVLVAPWINSQKEEDITMFDTLQIDSTLMSRTGGVTIFSSSNDDQAIKNSITVLSDSIKGIKIVEFSNYGHFCLGDMKTREFPELLAEALNS
jgi:predicted alpha/beta hydrolase family esterase